MPEELVNGLIATLRRNKDFFAWKTIDIPGINPDVISHKYFIYREVKSLAQKREGIWEKKSGG